VEEPFLLISYHLEVLRSYAKLYSPEVSRPDNCSGFEDTYDDIIFLIELIEKRIGRSMSQELQRHQAPKPVCTYNMLWTLFKPGTKVYYDRLEISEYNTAAVVKGVTVIVHGGSVTNVTISYWWMSYDSVYVGATNDWAVTIEPFIGEKETGSLYVFPCEYLKVDMHKMSHKDKRQKLEERGENFFDLLKGPKCVMFDGQSTNWPRRHVRQAVVPKHARR